jgi:hypothetical protein
MQTTDEAFVIRQAMQRTYTDCPLESFGAPTSGSLKLLFQDSESCSSVIEWVDNYGNKVIAVFHSDNSNLPCSRIGLWGIGREAKLIWEVSDTEVFKVVLPMLQLALCDQVNWPSLHAGAHVDGSLFSPDNAFWPREDTLSWRSEDIMYLISLKYADVNSDIYLKGRTAFDFTDILQLVIEQLTGRSDLKGKSQGSFR